MDTPTHLLVNSAISIPLKLTFGWDWTHIVLFIIAGGILIDLDHLLFFGFKYKTINPKKWISIGKKMRSKKQPGLYISTLIFVPCVIRKGMPRFGFVSLHRPSY